MKKILISLAAVALLASSSMASVGIASKGDNMLSQFTAKVQVDTGQDTSFSFMSTSKIDARFVPDDYPRVQIALQDGAVCVHSVTLGNANMKTNILTAGVNHLTINTTDMLAIISASGAAHTLLSVNNFNSAGLTRVIAA